MFLVVRDFDVPKADKCVFVVAWVRVRCVGENPLVLWIAVAKKRSVIATLLVMFAIVADSEQGRSNSWSAIFTNLEQGVP